MEAEQRGRTRVVEALAALIVALVVSTSCTSAKTSPSPTDPESPLSSEAVALAGTSGLSFTDVSAAAGLDEPHASVPLSARADMSSGAAVADVDGDGDLDVFLPRIGQPNRLLINDGSGVFTDVAAEAGVAGPRERFGSSAAAFFDADGDGDLDLFVAGAQAGANEFFINDGTGRFTEESADRGMQWPPPNPVDGSQHHGVAVADVNGDGHMDLLVLQWHTEIFTGDTIAAAEASTGRRSDGSTCDTSALLAKAGFPTTEDTPATRSRLFLNDGTGNFVDGAQQMDLPLHEVIAFGASFSDIDDDGWMDLAITGDGCTSRLFRNEGGERFIDITGSAGVGTDENGMGTVLADIDGDGIDDWFVTSIFFDVDGDCPVSGFTGCSGNRLFLGNGDRTFRDATDDMGVRDGGWGWGAVAEDFTNRGIRDLAMTNGFRMGPLTDPTASGPSVDFMYSFGENQDRFWMRPDDGGPFIDVSDAVGLTDSAVGHAMVAFDMDGDGDLDLLVVPSGEDSPRLYRNDLDADRSWLTVGLDDSTTPGNRWGDGARVEVQSADASARRTITTSGSYESQGPPVVHFGLDRTNGPVQVRVWWPGEAEPQLFDAVEVGQRVVLNR